MLVVVAGAVGAVLGGIAVAVADRWCGTPARWHRVLGAVALAGSLALLAARGPAMPRGSAAADLCAGLGFTALAVLAIPLARVDLTVRRLPDVLVLPGYVLVGGALSAADPGAVPRAVAAAAACVAGYGLLCGLGGLGFGDVKLGGLLGFALGWSSWQAVVLGVGAGLVLGAAHALVLMALGRSDRRTPVPFGPAMLVGALAGLAWPG